MRKMNHQQGNNAEGMSHHHPTHGFDGVANEAYLNRPDTEISNENNDNSEKESGRGSYSNDLLEPEAGYNTDDSRNSISIQDNNGHSFSNEVFSFGEGGEEGGINNSSSNSKSNPVADIRSITASSDELLEPGVLKTDNHRNVSKPIKVWNIADESSLGRTPDKKSSNNIKGDDNIILGDFNKSRDTLYYASESGGIIPISYKKHDVSGGFSNKTPLATNRTPPQREIILTPNDATSSVNIQEILPPFRELGAEINRVHEPESSKMIASSTHKYLKITNPRKNRGVNGAGSNSKRYSVNKLKSGEVIDNADKHPDIDGGWSYAIAIAVFFAAFIQDGPKNSFGILLPNLERDIDSSVTLFSFSAGLLDGTWLFLGPFTAKLIKRFGCRPVAFLGGIVTCVAFALSTLSTNIEMFISFYGVMAGIGIGLFNLPTITMVNHYFRKKRGLVLGFVTSGSGVGLLVMSLVVERLIEYYGWRGAYLIVAGFYLQICLCASVLRPLSPWQPTKTSNQQLTHNDGGNVNDARPEKEDVKIQNGTGKKISITYEFDGVQQIMSPTDEKETKDTKESNETINEIEDVRRPPEPDQDQDEDSALSLMKEPCFVLFCFTAFLIQLTNNIAPIFYPSYAKSMGISSAQAARIVSVFGISNTLGRFSTGLMSHFGVNNLLLYSVGTSLTGLLYFLIPLYKTYGSLLASAAGQGFFIGVFPPLQSVILVELLGLERLPYSFGIMSFCKSVGSAAGPALSGALYQLVNDYTLPFVFAGSLLTIANFLHVLLEVLRRKKLKRSQSPS